PVPSAWPAPTVRKDTPPPRPTVADQPVPEQARPERSENDAPAADPVVRILSGTRRYHTSDCALIEDIGDEAEDLEALPRSEAQARGCTPCLVCQPDKEHTRG
ncbi:MAG TPA: hypothetical protein VHJ17_14630, partial [Thermomonospora sp.]|nr:hypothetical protein [Thermomonospora sp.]